MTVVIAIYQHIYCRYLAPGECVVHDRGPEFCNEVHDVLHQSFGVDIRIISAARPRGNGLVEGRVKVLKEKARALMSEDGGSLPLNWDQTLLYKVLSILRSDPSRATGFAPGELLLGRPLVFPTEFRKSEVDLSGTELTVSIVQALTKIHNDAFGAAGEKIDAYQKAYKQKYDKRMNVKEISLDVGEKVQLLKKPRKKMGLKWAPHNGYFEVLSVDPKKMIAMLRNPVTKYIFKKSKPISHLRIYRGK